MAKIIAVATATPSYTHQQMDILRFMNSAYGIDEKEQRKIRYLYKVSGIEQRHSVLEDFALPMEERRFFPNTEDLEPFPLVDQRMKVYNEEALKLSLQAIQKLDYSDVTHIITVSCTGMSAPGLDLQLLEELHLPASTERTSINFMGCYAAVHALKQANYIANCNPNAKVLIVATELCTLHFQKLYTLDSIAATLLFGDGCAATIVVPDAHAEDGIHLKNFYSEVQVNGKKDMAWEISSTGFVMTLSGYVPEIIELELLPLFERACAEAGYRKEEIEYWCMHPGGKKVLEAIQNSLSLPPEALSWSRDVLRENGNVSSATILFVLARMFPEVMKKKTCKIFGAAFGPGLTMESMMLTRG